MSVVALAEQTIKIKCTAAKRGKIMFETRQKLLSDVRATIEMGTEDVKE